MGAPAAESWEWRARWRRLLLIEKGRSNPVDGDK